MTTNKCEQVILFKITGLYKWETLIQAIFNYVFQIFVNKYKIGIMFALSNKIIFT